MRAFPSLLAALAAPAIAQAPDLAPLKAALLPLRTTPGANQERDAGPELTPVKNELRRWVEAQLPPTQRPGPDGTLLVPDDAAYARLAARLTAALDAAGLTCGAWGEPDYRCGPADPSAREDGRGHVGPVRLTTLGGGRWLLLVTGVGVRCGDDESAYVYEQAADHRWRLLLATEQDRYREGGYAPQNFLAVDAAGPAALGAAPPLVATLGSSPWCSSNWNRLTTRLWRASRATPTPAPLIDRTDGLYEGTDLVAAERLTAGDLLVQYTDRSADGDRLVRPHVRRWTIGPGDTPARADPVALSPADFVDEWLASDGGEARGWLDPAADVGALMRAHGPDDPAMVGAYATTRCRADPTRWQVRFTPETTAGQPPARFFQVRWEAPYRFRLVAAGARAFAGCDIKAETSDPVGTLFPLQGKAP